MLRKSFVLFLSSLMVLSVYAPSVKGASVSGSKVVDIAKKYAGTPYDYGGTTTSGFDCSGFTQYVFEEAGVDLPRNSSQQNGVGEYVAKSDLQAGDLVFFSKTPGSDNISHVGIYTSNDNYISATVSKGVNEVSINDPYYWGPRYVGAKRVLDDKSQASNNNSSVGEYHDVTSDHWATHHIERLSQEGIINGDENQNFNPEDDVTRAEAAKMVSEALGLKTSSSNAFHDSSSHWANEYINAAADEGIIVGDGNGAFRPNESIQRDEIAAILTRAFNLSSDGSKATFNDVSKDHWAFEKIEALSDNSIATGTGNNKFEPRENATRAEFTAFLDRAL
ncbi:S-layer homology domain-containing protein [Halobacillus sp. A1]|uniref:C40 family peptidase n=1 Tax=Halobacillus sp. A1 TaxID=2880262 RepID=UPI0020A68B49|nr:C40 family peptidase [Halobacillus sp. A1]MCP3031453.1 S-layer homology domain-containing protein [Halobacillus sp. A1]